MDLGRWLRDRKKQLEGAKAQVNPFDNGQTYSTVVNNQRPGSNPFVDNRIKNAKYGVLANNKQAQDNFLNSIKQNNRPEMATFESLKNVLNNTRDVFDANTQNDVNKRLKQGQPANYFDQQKQNNTVKGESRGVVGQATYPIIGSVGGFFGSLPGQVGQLAGNAIQEPTQFVAKQMKSNPITHPAGFAGYANDNIRNSINKIRGNENGKPSFIDQTAIDADKTVPEIVKNYGRGIQGYSEDYEDLINQKVNDSRFTPQTRQGENRLLTGVSSGLGSLGSAVGVTALTKNPNLASAMFGVKAGAETTRDARDNGLSASDALNVGLQRGVAEGTLEKFGLERFFRGAQGSLLSTAINSVTTEAPQEFLQSLAGATASSQYKDVDWNDAFKQAFTEGALGGITGLIGGAAINVSGFSSGLQKSGVDKQDADFIASEVAKKQTETKNPTLQQTNIPAEPGSIRDRIQQAKENVKTTIAETNQLLRQDDAGGYGGGSNAQDRININNPDGANTGGFQINNPDNARMGLEINNPDGAQTKPLQIKNPDGATTNKPLKVKNNTGAPLVGEGLFGAAQQSFLAKSPFKGDQDSVTRMELDYLEGVQGPSNSLQGEGAKAPVQLDQNKKQSLLEKTRAAAKKLNQNIGDKGGATAGDIPGLNKLIKDQDPLDSLMQEARKYKSAEEFVNSKANAYHGSDKVFDEMQVGRPTKRRLMFGEYDTTSEGMFFAPDGKVAREFGENVGKYYVDVKKPLVFSDRANDKFFNDFDKSIENVEGIDIKPGESGFSEWMYLDGELGKRFKAFAKEKGFDGAKIDEASEFTGDNFATTVAFDNDQVKSTKQITDLYNQATKKKGLLSLKEEKGGATAEDIPGLGGILKKQEAKAKSKSPLTDQAYAETFGVSLEEAKRDVSTLDKTKAMPLDSVGMTEQEATKKLESNAPTMSPGNKKTKSLVDSMINDKKLTEAARIAQKEGKELNYFAKKDNNGRSVGIEEYNPSRQRIEAGFVVDNSTGKILGNHIKVDATGIQVNVGGEVVNIGDIVGNPLDWRGDYEVSSTMERNIFKNAPSKEIAQKTYKFVIANKIQAEANFRKEIESQRKTLNQNVKNVLSVKPKSVKQDDFKSDVFDFIEGKKSQADIAKNYGPKATQAIVKYKSETRKLYDTLLDRANTELAKFGEKTIPRRSDYITHINELNQQPSFAGELMGQLQNSMLGEGNTTTRGSVPGDIAGRTENFSPRKRWNPFAQQRKGGEYTKDPFKAVDSYLEPTLYNIHMTESAVRARAVESAFRTADQIRQSDASKVKTQLGSELAKYNKNTNNGKLISGFQEYANSLAGKTQRWDRQLIDASKATADGLKGWQGLQRIGGRATILGNVNSILMQPLNQVSTFADTGVSNYIKGVARSMGNSKAENLSPFIKARATKAESNFRTKGQKVMDAAGVPMQVVELASVKLAWNAEYEQVLSEGLKGQDAIIEADRRTERVVAGRGIADKPEVYRSTAANGLFQYTLEVSAQNKKFWKDFTPAQKGKFVAGAFAMNQLIGLVSGNEPLPDYLDAAIESLKDWFGDDDETTGEKAIQTGQRLLSETVKFNPFVSSAANLLPKETRKTVFGEDSELSRFEGVPAPIGVVQNAIDVGKNVANGDVKKARDSALKLMPGGNQIRKTLQGKELIQDGAKLDKNGKVQYEAPESPLGKAQALLFGPSSTKNAREYYDSIGNKIAGALNKDSSGKTIDDFKTIAQASFGTEKGKEFMALTNDDQRKEFARASDENRGIYDQYKAMQKSFSGGDDLLPQGISQESEKVLNKYDRLVTGTKDKIFEREKGAEYEYNKASYERDLLDGKLSEVDKIRRQKYLAKDKIGAQYEKSIRDTYSLSKDQIKELVEGSKQGQKIYDQLVKYDQQLYDAGLIEYRKFKNGLSSGRGGRKSNGKSESYALESQTLKNLRRILDGTTFKGGAKVSTPKPGLAKQKKITVNTKA
jgi:hypothetical protein